MTRQEVAGLGYRTEVRNAQYEELPYVELIVEWEGAIIVASVDETGVVYECATTARSLSFARGARVGDTLARLRHLYPEGELVSGSSDGGFMNFVAGAHGTFEFDVSSVPTRCLDHPTQCSGDLESLPAVRYFVR